MYKHEFKYKLLIHSIEPLFLYSLILDFITLVTKLIVKK